MQPPDHGGELIAQAEGSASLLQLPECALQRAEDPQGVVEAEHQAHRNWIVIVRHDLRVAGSAR